MTQFTNRSVDLNMTSNTYVSVNAVVKGMQMSSIDTSVPPNTLHCLLFRKTEHGRQEKSTITYMVKGEKKNALHVKKEKLIATIRTSKAAFEHCRNHIFFFFASVLSRVVARIMFGAIIRAQVPL